MDLGDTSQELENGLVESEPFIHYIWLFGTQIPCLNILAYFIKHYVWHYNRIYLLVIYTLPVIAKYPLLLVVSNELEQGDQQDIGIRRRMQPLGSTINNLWNGTRCLSENPNAHIRIPNI